MATPHVSGLAAYILGLEGKRTPAQLGNRLATLSLKNIILSLLPGTINNLAFNGSPLF
jgi:subtilisin family serine protease